MQPISLIVAIVLGLAALSYVLYPLYADFAHRSVLRADEQPGSEGLSAVFPAQRGGPDARQAVSSVPRLSEREQHARQALQEVEFDFQLGNLDEREYRSLRARYMDRAVLEMKQRQQHEQEIDAEIEEQLRMLKEAENHGQA